MSSPLSLVAFAYTSLIPLARGCSLSARPKPTKEEIDQKNKNLALWFWGGGFVAPFLATFYYFGFKFWEK